MVASTLSIITTFFFVTNPIGNVPAILAMLKPFPFETQKKIMIREGALSLFIALFFQYAGEKFLSLLKLQNYTISITGGFLLLVVGLEMIFPKNHLQQTSSIKREPFMFPIATPLLAGPGLLTIIMLYASQEANPLKISFAIFSSFSLVIAVMAFAPYLTRILKERGMIALERLMGIVVTWISIEMIVKGIFLFKETI